MSVLTNMKCSYNVESPLMLATYITLWAIITNMCSSKSNTKYAVWLPTNMYSFIKSSLSSHFWNMRLHVSKCLKEKHNKKCMDEKILPTKFLIHLFLLQLNLLNESAFKEFKCRKLSSVKVSLNCPSDCHELPRVLQNTLS